MNETLTASAVGFVGVGVVHCLYPERDCAARLTVLWCVCCLLYTLARDVAARLIVLWCVCCLLYTLARDVAARVISAVVCLSSVCLSVCVRL